MTFPDQAATRDQQRRQRDTIAIPTQPPAMPRRPWLLDLFCGVGGASVGYHRAGFHVIGIDIQDQPDYPFEFYRIDAFHPLLNLEAFHVVHASTPCQHDCTLTAGTNAGREYPDLTERMRVRLRAARQSGTVYVMENPPGRTPLRRDAVLCGEMFGLDVIRHRVFEIEGASVSAPRHKPHRGTSRTAAQAAPRPGPRLAPRPVLRRPVPCRPRRRRRQGHRPRMAEGHGHRLDREPPLHRRSHPARVHRAHRPPPARPASRHSGLTTENET